MRGLLLAILLGAPSSGALAADWNRGRWGLVRDAGETNWQLELRPGFAVPRGPLGDVAKHSLTLHAGLERRLNRVFSLGLEVGHNVGHRYEGVHGVYGPFTSNAKVKVLQITPVVKFGFDVPLGYRSLRPFGVIGVGPYFQSRDPGIVTFLPSQTQRGIREEAMRGNLGLHVGAGITFRPSVRFRLGGEVRFHYYNQADDLDGDGRDRDSVRYLTPALVLAWMF